MKTLIDYVEEVYLINLQRCNTDNQRVVKEINSTDPYRLLELISVILEKMQKDTQQANNVPATTNDTKDHLVRKECTDSGISAEEADWNRLFGIGEDL